MTHKVILETTNDGNVFSDCTCGAALGVYQSRAMARAAHAAHVEGREPVGAIKTTLGFGGTVVGQLAPYDHRCDI